MSVIDVGNEFGGRLVGKYWVRWMGRNRPPGPEHWHAVMKMDSTPTLIVVEVRRFDIAGCRPKYAVRVPGQRGYFGLEQFEWHGNHPVE